VLPKSKRKFKPLFRSMSSESPESTNSEKPKRSAIFMTIHSDDDKGEFATPLTPDRVIGGTVDVEEEEDQRGNRKRVSLYTELTSSQRPQSKVREWEEGLHHSNSAATLSEDSRTRCKRYRHKRSKSHENYGKFVTNFPKPNCSSYAPEKVSTGLDSTFF